MVRFLREVAGEIVYIVERQLNSEPRSEWRYGLGAVLLGQHRRAFFDDQVVLSRGNLNSGR